MTLATKPLPKRIWAWSGTGKDGRLLKLWSENVDSESVEYVRTDAVAPLLRAIEQAWARCCEARDSGHWMSIEDESAIKRAAEILRLVSLGLSGTRAELDTETRDSGLLREWGGQRDALAVQCAQLRAELAKVQEALKDTHAALDRDRTGLAAALGAVVREVDSRAWVVEGRGPYEWDDDKYKEEAGDALAKVRSIATDALRQSGALASFVIVRGLHPTSSPSATAAALPSAAAWTPSPGGEAEDRGTSPPLPPGLSAGPPVELTHREAHLVSHALGHEKRYRNHFCASTSGEDYEVWASLESRGLATRMPDRSWLPEMVTFYVTDAGRAALDAYELARIG